MTLGQLVYPDVAVRLLSPLNSKSQDVGCCCWHLLGAPNRGLQNGKEYIPTNPFYILSPCQLHWKVAGSCCLKLGLIILDFNTGHLGQRLYFITDRHNYTLV